MVFFLNEQYLAWSTGLTVVLLLRGVFSSFHHSISAAVGPVLNSNVKTAFVNEFVSFTLSSYDLTSAMDWFGFVRLVDI